MLTKLTVAAARRLSLDELTNVGRLLLRQLAKELSAVTNTQNAVNADFYMLSNRQQAELLYKLMHPAGVPQQEETPRSALDLTEYCALCGGQLELEPGVNSVFSKPDNDMLTYCRCESRELKGRCGSCVACRAEQRGCVCDGYYDKGCFKCTPDEFARPACPKENFERGIR